MISKTPNTVKSAGLDVSSRRVPAVCSTAARCVSRMRLRPKLNSRIHCKVWRRLSGVGSSKPTAGLARKFSIQDIDQLAQREQFTFQFGGDRRLAGTGQARQPHDAARVAVTHSPLRSEEHPSE